MSPDHKKEEEMKKILIIGLFILLLCSSVYAMAPTYVTDAELTQYPIIVAAKWDKAEVKPHELIEGNVCREYEVFTELNVQRVIKGDIKPGKHTILMGRGIGWKKDGTRLGTWTSTDIPGDVDDVTKPNIWFLVRAQSWDTSDKTLYYSVSHYRAIQPLFLEEYFVALASDNPEEQVPKLLTSDNAELLRRILRYICGDIWPWPNEPKDGCAYYWNPEKRGNVLRKQSEAVRKVVERDVGNVRYVAASVYAELEGKSCIKYMRSLLNDKDPKVRGIAIGILIQYKDENSIEAMVNAVEGVNDGKLSCRVIEAVSSWGDERLVPLLITFLQNNAFAYQFGEDVGIPALKARKALYEITGHWFPYDIVVSTEIWKKVAAVRDSNERKKLLKELLPENEFPVVAELIGSPREASKELEDKRSMVTVRVKNASGQDITIAKLPTGVHQSCPALSSYRALHPPLKDITKKDFLTLKPSEWTEFEVAIYNRFLVSEPKNRNLKLSYTDNGNSVGVNAWIGSLDVKFGSNWKEERKIEKVEELWPNGNLKVTGQTVNGEKYGEWQYFNEDGDRIRIIYYASNRGGVICSPEHPDNKGAGKRQGNK